MSELLARITVDPQRTHGRPCIRDLRITVADVLGLLSAGQSRESILEDYPYLEEADIDAVLACRERIEINPQVMAGKPVITGTRMPIELLLRM